ncbi:MAG: hypothetical protein HFG71_08120 [Hungatella sp.]|jgi:hypothetical protein|nr:hypothetical protein [Hungatella sp.]
MRYFFITQDTGLSGAIRFRDFDIQKGGRLFTKADSKKLNDSVVLYLSGSGKEARPDFIQNPVTMCSYRLKDILEAYEDGIEFKDVVMIHKENSLQYNYVQILLEPIDALSGKSEWYPNGTLKRIVLDGKKIGEHHIFLLDGGYRRDPVISLPLAESLLRRDVTGICLEEAEVD